jgi:hypothetical protein
MGNTNSNPTIKIKWPCGRKYTYIINNVPEGKFIHGYLLPLTIMGSYTVSEGILRSENNTIYKISGNVCYDKDNKPIFSVLTWPRKLQIDEFVKSHNKNNKNKKQCKCNECKSVNI